MKTRQASRAVDASSGKITSSGARESVPFPPTEAPAFSAASSGLSAGFVDRLSPGITSPQPTWITSPAALSVNLIWPSNTGTPSSVCMNAK